MKTCPHLTTKINFEPHDIRPCCERMVKMPTFPFSGGSFDLREYTRFLSDTLTTLQHEDSVTCKNCMIKNDVQANDSGIPQLALPLRIATVLINHFRDWCNGKCSYCPLWRKPQKLTYNVLPILKQFDNLNLITQDAKFSWGGGEVSILPEFEEVATWIADRGSKQSILTNALVYSPAIEKLLIRGSVAPLNVSLDSGTPEMYKKVKGVDKFDTVCENIKKYVSASPRKSAVSLKFIILQSPCNIDDIDAFFALCLELGISNVQYNFDFRMKASAVEKKTWDAALYFEKMTKFYNMPCYVAPATKELTEKFNEYRKSAQISSKTTSNNKNKLFIVNPGMNHKNGHDYFWNALIQNKAQQKGVETSFIFRDKFPPESREGAQALLAEFANNYPILPDTIYKYPFFKKIDDKSHDTFIEQAQSIQKEFTAFSAPYGAQTVFLSHTADPATMLGILWWCASLPPESQPRLFFHFHFSFQPLGEWAEKIFSLIRDALPGVRQVQFAACVDYIAAFLEQHLERKIIILPMPFQCKAAPSAPGDIVYGYAGGGRKEQGLAILAPLVTEYIRRGGKNKFLFQIGFTEKNTTTASFKNEILQVAEKFPDQVTLIPQIITGNDYQENIHKFRLILLPYSVEAYHLARPSQILQESIAMGIPSLVCKGSSLAYEVGKAVNGSLIVDDLEVNTICDALFAFEANAEKHSEKARIAGEKYRAYNNADHFMSVVLQTGEPSPEVLFNSEKYASIALTEKNDVTESNSSTKEVSKPEDTKKTVVSRRKHPVYNFFLHQVHRYKLHASPLFQHHYYLTQNPEVQAAGMDPLKHFLCYGWKEGRKPNPLFDPAYYLSVNNDVALAGFNPLIHYMEHGWKEGRNPSPLFDPFAYLALHGDVVRAKMEPLMHYLRFGVLEGRRLA